MNEEILKNVINICALFSISVRNSQYLQTRWLVNDEPFNTFGTLELPFPISKKEFVLVLSQFPKMNLFLTSCYVPKSIILVLLVLLH